MVRVNIVMVRVSIVNVVDCLFFITLSNVTISEWVIIDVIFIVNVYLHYFITIIFMLHY